MLSQSSVLMFQLMAESLVSVAPLSIYLHTLINTTVEKLLRGLRCLHIPKHAPSVQRRKHAPLGRDALRHSQDAFRTATDQYIPSRQRGHTITSTIFSALSNFLYPLAASSQVRSTSNQSLERVFAITGSSRLGRRQHLGTEHRGCLQFCRRRSDGHWLFHRADPFLCERYAPPNADAPALDKMASIPRTTRFLSSSKMGRCILVRPKFLGAGC